MRWASSLDGAPKVVGHKRDTSHRQCKVFDTLAHCQASDNLSIAY